MNATELNGQLETYLGLREALGLKLRVERPLLQDFVRFIEAHGDAGPIRTQWALDWACASAARRGSHDADRRLGMARGFLAFLRATVPDTEVPAPGLLASAPRATPYLFSPAQITTLIDAALEARPRGSLRPHTLATLIGLLASTGLRVGEAVRLRPAEVALDLDPPQLHIVQSKCHKSRIVPLHPTTAAKLQAYGALKTAHRIAGSSDAFFVSAQGQPLTTRALGCWFARLCRQLGMTPRDGGRPPRLHCLRHAFAIQRLQRWYEEGQDVQALLPHLSVYLGHVGPQTSYWYLTAVPELLAAAAERFQDYAAPGGAS